ncbi:hypothetical protein CLV42_104568 [Chitinophaga ginsengisoli]|uniref:Uncharacterized protein n=1 Tax=Chitinophaga ginsengisoli TaxID=363837 RepID=A0A2P8GED9_9BACT|nr:hypothetical protein CLV42_104568 [Chitinophaga ginsengisoli]
MSQNGIHIAVINSPFVFTKPMPPEVHFPVEHQPLNSTVEVTSALLSHQPAGIEIWVALAWCVGITLLTCGVAMSVYRKRR